MPGRTAYWDYIKVEQLLQLQTGTEPSVHPTAEADLSDDEVRFIVIHQIDELWFKLALRELQSARDLFGRDHVPETSLASAAASLRRIALMFDLAARHFALMETMRTQDYLRFRDKLSPASGFQSAQMREIEILLGLDADTRVPFGKENSFLDMLRGPDGGSSPALERVQKRMQDLPNLKEAVYRWLARTPIQGSSPTDPGDDEVVLEWIEQFLAGHERSNEELIATTIAEQAATEADRGRLEQRYREQLQSAREFLTAADVDAEQQTRVRRIRAAILFIDSYRHLPLLSWPGEIVDGLAEAEQAMLIFRQRHARMVERVIGRRVGTGGSDGVDYLDQTALQYRIFREIWAARTLLLQPGATPTLRNAEFYGLRHE